MCCQGVYGLSFPRHDNDEFSALYLLTVETQKGERRLTELLSVGLFFPTGNSCCTRFIRPSVQINFT